MDLSYEKPRTHIPEVGRQTEKAANKAADLLRKGRPFRTAVKFAADYYRVSFSAISAELSRMSQARRAMRAA